MNDNMTYNTVLAEYEEFLADGKFPFQRCNDCGEPQWFPRILCRSCLSRDVSWEMSSGLGTLHSFSILYRSPEPTREMPYVVALVDLDEGFRAMTTMEDPADPRLDCDARVELKRIEQIGGNKVAVFGIKE